MNIRNLRLARTASGLSLRSLANAIGNRVTAQAISKYERGEATPGSAVLMALADALGVTVDYLIGEGEMALEGIEFRRPAISSKREEAQVAAKVLGLLERYLAVEGLLGLPSVDWDKPREAPFPVAANMVEADCGAAVLRTHWGLGIAPVPALTEVLEGRGIKVVTAEFSGVAGVMAHVRRAGRRSVPVVVVNSGACAERQRFAIARELGHLVLAAGRKVAAEDAANRFAGAFLMPAEALWAEVGKRRSAIGLGELVRLKPLFGVSAQALANRCRDLGIFGPSLHKRLFQEFGRRGWHSPPFGEPLSQPDSERPQRFERLCLRALAEGVVSEPKAAELLNVAVRELNRRMEAPPDASGASHLSGQAPGELVSVDQPQPADDEDKMPALGMWRDRDDIPDVDA